MEKLPTPPGIATGQTSSRPKRDGSGGVATEETVTGLAIGQLRRTQAFHRVKHTSVHGEAVGFEERSKRTVTVAGIWASAFALPGPDEVSRCPG